MHYTSFSSPLGELMVVADSAGLRRLIFLNNTAFEVPGEWQQADDRLVLARQQILAYLDGRRRSFSLEIAPEGNEFQRDVWAALLRIPYGQTRTYGDLAQRLGGARTARSISAASAVNPLPLLIPCHRVVAANGPGSYSGGLAIKRHLLAFESASLDDASAGRG